jgi:hypothetical protein
MGGAVEGAPHRLPLEERHVGAHHRRVLVTGDGGEDLRSFGNGVRERCLPGHPIALRRLAREEVVPFGEALVELLERELVERRLGALEEELGEALRAEAPLGRDLEDVASVRSEDEKALPGLAVEADLHSHVLGGGIELHQDPRPAERNDALALDRGRHGKLRESDQTPCQDDPAESPHGLAPSCGGTRSLSPPILKDL